jgi:hypothetical protein
MSVEFKDLEKVLTVEIQKTLLCTLKVSYGNDMTNSSCRETLDRIVQACKKYNLQYTISKEQRYCCTDYQFIKINAQTSVYDVFKIIEDIKLSVDVYIRKDGSIIASYDNTYC